MEACLRPGDQIDARPHRFRDGRGPLDWHDPRHRRGAVDRHRDVHFDRHVSLPRGEAPPGRLTGLKADPLDHFVGPGGENPQFVRDGGRSEHHRADKRAPHQTEQTAVRHESPRAR